MKNYSSTPFCWSVPSLLKPSCARLVKISEAEQVHFRRYTDAVFGVIPGVVIDAVSKFFGPCIKYRLYRVRARNTWGFYFEFFHRHWHHMCLLRPVYRDTVACPLGVCFIAWDSLPLHLFLFKNRSVVWKTCRHLLLPFRIFSVTLVEPLRSNVLLVKNRNILKILISYQCLVVVWCQLIVLFLHIGFAFRGFLRLIVFTICLHLLVTHYLLSKRYCLSFIVAPESRLNADISCVISGAEVLILLEDRPVFCFRVRPSLFLWGFGLHLS